MKWLLSLFLALVVGLFFLTDDLRLSKNETQKMPGLVVSSKGVVMGRPAEGKLFKSLKANSPLSRSHKIITGIESSGLIQFGETFRILANSSIQVLKLGNKYQVHLLKGEIQRQVKTNKTDFLIDNKVMDRLKLIQKEKNSLSETAMEGKKLTTFENNNGPKSKTHELLDKTFKLHQRFIEKCFIKHYERLEGQTQSGIVLMDFEINSKGRVENVLVKNSQYADEKFHSCLKEVVSRVKIKRRPESLVRVEFPIKINLPL